MAGFLVVPARRERAASPNQKTPVRNQGAGVEPHTVWSPGSGGGRHRAGQFDELPDDLALEDTDIDVVARGD